MKRLKLNLDSLVVESFATDEMLELRGTVQPNEETPLLRCDGGTRYQNQSCAGCTPDSGCVSCLGSCYHTGCGQYTCQYTCENTQSPQDTCYDTCGGMTGVAGCRNTE